MFLRSFSDFDRRFVGFEADDLKIGCAVFEGEYNEKKMKTDHRSWDDVGVFELSRALEN